MGLWGYDGAYDGGMTGPMMGVYEGSIKNEILVILRIITNHRCLLGILHASETPRVGLHTRCATCCTIN
jgi:hypothetical protein